MKIDCDTCSVRGKACGDCVVSFLTIAVRPQAAPADDTRAAAGAPSLDTARALVPETPPDAPRPGAVELDADQARAVRAMAAGGLVPPLRHMRIA